MHRADATDLADLADLADLDLCFGAPLIPSDPPPIGAFAHPLRAAPGAAEPLGDDDLALLHSAALAEGSLPLGPADDRVRLVPLLDLALAPIPLPEPEASAAPVVVADWALDTEVRGHLALIRRRGLSIVAVALPLLVPGLAAAAPAPELQRPSAAASTAPAPREAPEDAPLEPAAPAADEWVEPAAAPAPAEAPARSVPDVFWRAMKGQEVVLVLGRGDRRRGRLITSDADSILFVDYADDGRLRVLPKDSVLELRGAPPRTAALLGPPEGGGRIAGGAVMTAVGAPLLITGLVFLGACPSCISVSLPTFVPGALLVGLGIPLIVKGARMRRAWNEKARALARVTPGLVATPRGWAGGLTVRF